MFSVMNIFKIFIDDSNFSKHLEEKLKIKIVIYKPNNIKSLISEIEK